MTNERNENLEKEHTVSRLSCSQERRLSRNVLVDAYFLYDKCHAQRHDKKNIL